MITKGRITLERSRIRRATLALALAMSISGLLLAAVYLNSGGYQARDLRDLSAFRDDLPSQPGLTWEDEFERQVALGVTEPIDRCFPSRCEEWFSLVEANRALDDFSAYVGAVSLYAEMYRSPVEARWHHWRSSPPWPQSIDSRPLVIALSAPSVSADRATLTCYTHGEATDLVGAEQDGCLWSYHARYGQYVIALDYGNDRRVVPREEFIREFVEPFDRFIVGMLVEGRK